MKKRILAILFAMVMLFSGMDLEVVAETQKPEVEITTEEPEQNMVDGAGETGTESLSQDGTETEDDNVEEEIEKTDDLTEETEKLEEDTESLTENKALQSEGKNPTDKTESVEEDTEILQAAGSPDTQMTEEYNEDELEKAELEKILEGALEDDPMAPRANGYETDDFYGTYDAGNGIMLFGMSGYTHNSRYNGATIRDGIDVSYYQGDIDWNAVKNSGIEFVIIRVGYRGYQYGNLSEDPKYIQNIQGALNAGLKVGVYIFSQAINESEAVEEANFLLNRISGYNISLPIVMDFEYVSGVADRGRLYTAGLSKDQATSVCSAFANTVKNAGYTPMIYANKSMLENQIDGNYLGTQYEVWLANYTTQTSYSGPYSFWQYSSSGYVNGISGRVDMNFWYDDADFVNVKDGVYTISTALDGSKVLDIVNGSSSNSANVQIYASNNSNAQKFYVRSVGANMYTIMSLASGKMLDAANSGTALGTNVQQYDYGDSDAQKWYFKDGGNNTVIIENVKSGMVLDVAGASSVNGTNVQLYSANNSAAQKFKLNASMVRPLEDGTYVIKSAGDSKKVLDVTDMSTANGARIQLYSYNGNSAQKFKFTYNEDGYYTIQAVCSGKVLEVAGNSIQNGAALQQYSANASAAQRWIVVQKNDGYSIISVASGRCIDLPGGSTRDYTKTQLYSVNDGIGQIFSIVDVSGQTVPDGTYTISSAMNENMVLDVCNGSKENHANIWLYQSNYTDAQQFKLEYVGSGYYRITSKVSGKVLDVQNAANCDGANVQQYQWTNNPAQLWKIQDAGDGYYYLVSALGNRVLDVSGGRNANGANIQIYTKNGTKAQKFKLVNDDSPLVADGSYTIVSALDKNKVLDVANGSVANHANIQLYSRNGSEAQKFRITYLGNGYYKIASVKSGKVLDVQNAANCDGANIQQYQWTNNPAQLWKIQDAGNGYYYFVSGLGTRVLDISGAKSSDGTNIQIYTKNGTKAQKFQLLAN